VNPSNLGVILAERAREFPLQLAIMEPRWPFGWRDLTYAALAAEADLLAARFHEAGLQQGDAVLVLVPVSAKLYAVLAALFRCGLTAVFLDPSAGKQHVARCVEMVPPRAVVRSRKAALLDLAMPSLRRIPRKITVGAGFGDSRAQKETVARSSGASMKCCAKRWPSNRASAKSLRFPSLCWPISPPASPR
jgi:non-ribosomal peptide synthetase component E (peptide arylation enzyme)